MSRVSVVAGNTLAPQAAQQTSRFADLLARLVLPWKPQSMVEWLWWPVFAVSAFLPSSWAPVLQIGDLFLTLTDFVLAAFACACIPFIIIYTKRYRRSFVWTFLPFTALAAYAIATAFWLEDYWRPHFLYLVFPMFMAYAAMVVGFTVVASIRRDHLKYLAYRQSFAIALVVLAYTLVGYFQPAGFQSDLYVDSLFGIVRLAGPLGKATDFPGVFVAAISFLLLGMRRVSDSIVPILIAGVLTVGILLCGSRAGILSLLLFFGFAAISRASLRAKVAVLAISLLAAVATFQVVLPDRFLVFEESYRSLSYETGLAAWTDNPRTIVFGHGYGQIWPWYAKEIRLVMGEKRSYEFVVKTLYGKTVFNPHSVYINLLAETGLLGLSILALALGTQLWPALWAGSSRPLASRLLPGIAASLVIPAFGALLLKYFVLSAVWWIFFFVMASEFSSADKEPKGAKAARPR